MIEACPVMTIFYRRCGLRQEVAPKEPEVQAFEAPTVYHTQVSPSNAEHLLELMHSKDSE